MSNLRQGNYARIFIGSLTFLSLSLHYLIFFLPSSVQVMQVMNADAIVVKLNSGECKTIHLSSIRPPRLEGEVRVNARLSLDIPVTKAITESTGCQQSADVMVFALSSIS